MAEISQTQDAEKMLSPLQSEMSKKRESLWKSYDSSLASVGVTEDQIKQATLIEDQKIKIEHEQMPATRLARVLTDQIQYMNPEERQASYLSNIVREMGTTAKNISNVIATELQKGQTPEQAMNVITSNRGSLLSLDTVTGYGSLPPLRLFTESQSGATTVPKKEHVEHLVSLLTDSESSYNSLFSSITWKENVGQSTPIQTIIPGLQVKAFMERKGPLQLGGIANADFFIKPKI